MSQAITENIGHARLAPELKRERQRRILTGDEILMVKTLRAQGGRMEDIALALKIGQRLFRRLCQENRIPTINIEARAERAAALFRRLGHAKRLTLFDNEVEIILGHRARYRTWEYIAEEIGVQYRIMARELRARGIPTHRQKKPSRITKGCGQWRSFDPVDVHSGART